MSMASVGFPTNGRLGPNPSRIGTQRRNATVVVVRAQQQSINSEIRETEPKVVDRDQLASKKGVSGTKFSRGYESVELVTSKTRRSSRLNATKGGVSSVCVPLPPDRPLWFPGSSPPEWLDGSLPGDFGFDPLGLGSDPDLLKWLAQAELMHSRWAMLGVAGILVPEWLETLDLLDNYSWYDAGSREYFADPTTLFVVQLALMGWVEGRRWADMLNPGSVDIEPTYPNKKKPKSDVGYPGGLFFDPLMWGRGSPEPVMVLRTKEIKNGRLAMLAFLGFCFQAVYTGQGPLDNLSAHLADPGHCNIFSAFASH